MVRYSGWKTLCLLWTWRKIRLGQEHQEISTRRNRYWRSYQARYCEDRSRSLYQTASSRLILEEISYPHGFRRVQQDSDAYTAQQLSTCTNRIDIRLTYEYPKESRLTMLASRRLVQRHRRFVTALTPWTVESSRNDAMSMWPKLMMLRFLLEKA